MGIKFPIFSDRQSCADAIKDTLVEWGFSDVVSGGRRVTVPSPSGMYKARYGIRIDSITSGLVDIKPIVCDSHTEGSAPTGEEIFSGNTLIYIDVYYGFTIVGLPNSTWGIANIGSGGNGGYVLFIPAVDVDSGDPIGVYQRSYGSSGNHIEDGWMDSDGIDSGQISFTLMRPVYPDKIYLTPVLVGSGASPAALGVGVYGGSHATNETAVVPMVKVGSEVYLNVARIFVRIL